MTDCMFASLECVSLELSNSNLEDRHEDSVLEWNHDNFKQVGGSSVLTINVSMYFTLHFSTFLLVFLNSL